MKNFPKAGLLIITLVTPALIFVFLTYFGTNHYVLPYYNPQININGEVIIENGDTLFKKISEVKLKSAKKNVENRIIVISYIPKDCTDSCLLMFAQLERINNLAADIPDLVILSLTEDTKGSLIHSGELGTGKWNALQTSEADAKSAMHEQLGLPAENFENKLVLIDRKGFIRGFYNGADSDDADRLMAEIKILQYEDKNSTH